MSLQSPTLSFAPDKAKAAAERVQRAAAKFGPEQSKAAKAWAKNAVGAGSADATSLLREEVGSTNPYPSRLAFGGGSAARSMRPRCPFYATALPVPCDRAAQPSIAGHAGAAATTPSKPLCRPQVMLFGECILSEDGSPSKCQELEEAITAFQSMVPQAEAEVEMEPSAYQGGQFAVSTGRRRNNCYPYK